MKTNRSAITPQPPTFARGTASRNTAPEDGFQISQDDQSREKIEKLMRRKMLNRRRK